MLGIVAPLLLLSVMGFFAWRGISIAESEAADQTRTIAMERNRETANFAASALESYLESLFRTLEYETEKPEFREYFSSFLDSAGDELLASLATEKPPQEPLAKLLALEERDKLEKYIAERFQKLLNETAKTSNDTARFSSLLVNDRYGNAVAVSFAEAQESPPVGWNFAYRSYLTVKERIFRRPFRERISAQQSIHTSALRFSQRQRSVGRSPFARRSLRRVTKTRI